MKGWFKTGPNAGEGVPGQGCDGTRLPQYNNRLRKYHSFMAYGIKQLLSFTMTLKMKTEVVDFFG